MALRSVALGEGLEKLGECAEQGCYYSGAFRSARIEHVTLPSTLRLIGDSTFRSCRKLKRVTFAEKSALEKIGKRAFSDSGIVEVTLPGTLREIGNDAFADCRSLQTVRVEDGCEARLCCTGMPASVCVVPSLEVTLGDKSLLELRKLKSVVIPDGVERIGRFWFWGSEVESVEIPASVKEIGIEAFCNCKRLKKLVFKKNRGRGTKVSAPVSQKSRLRVIHAGAFQGCSSLASVELPDGLEEIGSDSFRKSGLKSIATPASTRVISQGAFCYCVHLRRAVLNEGLEVLGDESHSGYQDSYGVFQGSALASVTLPSTLRKI